AQTDRGRFWGRGSSMVERNGFYLRVILVKRDLDRIRDWIGSIDGRIDSADGKTRNSCPRKGQALPRAEQSIINPTTRYVDRRRKARRKPLHRGELSAVECLIGVGIGARWIEIPA